MKNNIQVFNPQTKETLNLIIEKYDFEYIYKNKIEEILPVKENLSNEKSLFDYIKNFLAFRRETNKNFFVLLLHSFQIHKFKIIHPKIEIFWKKFLNELKRWNAQDLVKLMENIYKEPKSLKEKKVLIKDSLNKSTEPQYFDRERIENHLSNNEKSFDVINKRIHEEVKFILILQLIADFQAEGFTASKEAIIGICNQILTYIGSISEELCHQLLFMHHLGTFHKEPQSKKRSMMNNYYS